MNEKSISQKQLFFIILQSQIGIGLLSLPSTVFGHSKSDGWMSVLLAGISIQILILLLWTLLNGFKGKSIFEILVIVFGNYIGKSINILYTVYFLLVMALLALLFANLLKEWILGYTPLSVLILIILGTAIYIGKSDLRVLARFYMLTAGVTLISIILPWFAFTFNYEWAYLFPMGQSGVKNITIGAHDAIVAMIGFEIIAVILPFVQGTYKQSLKSVSLANMTVTFIYVYFTICCFLIFSPAEIKIISEPVLYLLKAVNFPWVERLDLIFLSIWIIPMTTSLVTYLYLSSKGAAYTFHKGQRKYAIWYLPLIVFIIGLFFSTEFEMDHFNKYVSVSSYIFTVFIPLLTLLVAIVRKKYNYRSSAA
ncbi:MAG: GerAB/ArcD/ProY family transporter [Solibacillus sp.]